MTDITWADKLTGNPVTANDMNAIKTAVNSKLDSTAVLLSTTASFTTALKAKLDGIESGATTDQTGAEIVSAINTQLGSTAWQEGTTGSGSGDVSGPTSSVDGHATVFDGTTGKLLKSAGAVPILEGDVRLTDARTPTVHDHPQSDITNLTADLSAINTSLATKADEASALTGNPDLHSLTLEPGEYWYDAASGTVTNSPTAEYALVKRSELAANRLRNDVIEIGEANAFRHHFDVYTGATGAETWTAYEYVTTYNLVTQLTAIPAEDVSGSDDWENILTNAIMLSPTGARLPLWAAGADKTTGRYLLTDASGNVVTAASIPAATTLSQVWQFSDAPASLLLMRQAWEPVALPQTTNAATMDGHAGWHRICDYSTGLAVTITLSNIHPGWVYRITKRGSDSLSFDNSGGTIPISNRVSSYSMTAGKDLEIAIVNRGSVASPNYYVFEITKDA